MERERGFTIIETMIALVILTIVVMGSGRVVGTFLHSVSTSSTKTVATEVATAQLEQIRADPVYPIATAAGTITGFPGYPSMKRVTSFNRLGGPTYAVRDYTVITIRVSEPTMRDTVNVTAVVAKP